MNRSQVLSSSQLYVKGIERSKGASQACSVYISRVIKERFPGKVNLKSTENLRSTSLATPLSQELLVWVVVWMFPIVPSCWCCLGRVRRYGFIERSMSLEVGSETLKEPHTVSSARSLFRPCGSRCGPSAFCPGHHAYRLLSCLPAMMDSSPSRTISPNKLFSISCFGDSVLL